MGKLTANAPPPLRAGLDELARAIGRLDQVRGLGRPSRIDPAWSAFRDFDAPLTARCAADLGRRCYSKQALNDSQRPEAEWRS